MSDAAKQSLKVALKLEWNHDDIFDATVSVTILDSCYKPGGLHEGLPKGRLGIPEMEYLTFDFTHTSDGKGCTEPVKPIVKTIQVRSSSAKPNCTAFAVVNGEVVGEDTKPFPRGKIAARYEQDMENTIMSPASHTQTITIADVPLRLTNFTIWSGGWEAAVWYAFATAPGKVVGVTSMTFNDPGWTHFLNWGVPVEREKMEIVAHDYFPEIHLNGNPTWHEHIILVFGWKNGGINIAHQRLNITAVVEIPREAREMVDSLRLNRSFGSTEPKRLELDHAL